MTEISMKKRFVFTLSAAVIGLGACASSSELVGTAAGAAVGHAVTGGSTVGTVAGGVVGYGAGHKYDEAHGH
jgi:hypothetical protein